MARLLLALTLIAPLPCAAQGSGDDVFLDPSEGEVEPTARPVAQRPSSEPRSAPPSAIDPPRQAGRWELAASLLSFFPVSADGFGAIIRAHALYRFDVPLMVRAELMPVAFSVADDGSGAGAFGLVSFGLDLHAFGLTAGVGAASNNEHELNVSRPMFPGGPAPLSMPEPGAMTVVIFGVRLGVADGLALWLRSGLAVDHERGDTEFALFEGWAQVPFDPVWAMTVRGSWAMSGTGELQVGMRAWLEGRGGPGSIALRLDGGLGRVVYHPPSRGRGYPDPVDHLGPGFGVGVEGRL